MDNFFSTTPVLSCARSMFMATDGLVYEPSNLTRYTSWCTVHVYGAGVRCMCTAVIVNTKTFT